MSETDIETRAKSFLDTAAGAFTSREIIGGLLAEITRLRAESEQLQFAIEEANDLLNGDSFTMGTEAWVAQYDEWANRPEVHAAITGEPLPLRLKERDSDG